MVATKFIYRHVLIDNLKNFDISSTFFSTSCSYRSDIFFVDTTHSSTFMNGALPFKKNQQGQFYTEYKGGNLGHIADWFGRFESG